MPEMLAYLNGRMLPASEACLPLYDAGVVLGATVTEMTRTINHRPFRLSAHIDRLFRSLERIGLAIPHSQDDLLAIAEELVVNNARSLHPGGDLGITHFVTAGTVPTFAGLADGSESIKATICVHTFPLRFELYAERMRRGVHLITPSIRQLPPACLDPALKCRSRMHYFLADREARATDPEASALLLDLAGHVTETSAANFLMVEEEKIISPRRESILPGISRAVVIELAERLGIAFEERDLPVSAILAADEAFLSSTPFCLMPVRQVNGVKIGDGQPGPVYRRLIDTWSQEVGVDIVRQINSCLPGAPKNRGGEGRPPVF